MAMTSQNINGKAAIYADTQNLGNDLSQKISVIELDLDNWPDDLPDINLISVYVEAVHRDYWESRIKEVVEGKIKKIPFPGVKPPDIVVNPVQEYAGSQKNAADIALVLDALDDLHTKRTDFVAVVSNDSDFVALYYKLQKVQARHSDRFIHNRGEAPFLLITHGNSGRSGRLDNLPQQNILQLPTGIESFETTSDPDITPPASTTVGEQTPADKPTPEVLAGAIASGIGYRHLYAADTGEHYIYTYRDAYHVIRSRYPQIPQHRLGHSEFSKWFYQEIWPIMKQHGATMVVTVNQNDPQDYSYRMTPEVRSELLKLQWTVHP